jgi:hypothetical protein
MGEAEGAKTNQKSKCKITVQKSKIPQLAVALAATVCSTIVEDVRQINCFMQNKANLHFTAENAEYAEKKYICVSDCPIKKCDLYPIYTRSL